MAENGDWNWGLVVPEGWITIDVGLPPADRRGALVVAVQELAETSPLLAEAAPRLVDVAHEVASHAVENDALFVAVGFETLGVDVITMAVAGYGLDGRTPPDLAKFAEILRTPHARDLDGRDVEVVTLPVGPAVRVHAISEGGPPDEYGKIVYVEGVDHFIPVPGGSDMLLLSCTTPSIAVGDMVTELFDEIASTVAIELV
jgi:hypothetical protein